MIPLGHDTIYIQKPVEEIDDSDNIRYLNFDTPDEIQVDQCFFQPFLPADKLQYEELRDRDYSRATYRIYAPPVAAVLDIQSHDRIRIGTEVYEVFGEVGVWRNRQGVLHHAQIIVQTKEG